MVCTFVLGSTAFAASTMPLTTNELLENYASEGPARHDPFFASLLDGVSAGINSKIANRLPTIFNDDLVPVFVPNAGFKTGGIHVGVSLSQNPAWCWDGCGQKTVPAPLIVFFPGLTEGNDHPYVDYVRHIVHGRKAHILVIPAPFSNDYLSANPVDPTAAYEAEARIAAELLRSVREKIGEWNVTEVQFVGFSYGAFLAPLVARVAVPKLTKITLLSAPISMKAIIHALDELDSALVPYPWEYSINKAALGTERLSWYGNKKQRLSFAKPYFAWFFQYGQITNALDLGQRFGCNWPLMAKAVAANPAIAQLPIDSSRFPTIDVGQPLTPADQAFREFAEDVRFWKTIENCTPQNLPFYESAKDSLPYWLEGLDKSVNIDIVVTKDDFLISAADWENSRSRLGSARLILLPYGGHNGYFASQWLKHYLQNRIETPSLSRTAN